MSDQPPADWYTDPEDESQYRYWDGSSWTEHRAPRHTDPADEPDTAAGGLRGPSRLVADTFSLTGRRWRSLAAPALIHIASDMLALGLLLVSANTILMGELGEIWARISEPGVDLAAPEHEAYFESLELDLAPVNFVPVALGLLALLVASNVMQAAVTRVALSDLKDRALTTPDALRQALARVPRLIGLDAQTLAIIVVATLATVLVGIGAPLLLIPLIPALIVASVYGLAVLPMAYAVASVGPRTWSLQYGARLVRGRFWATLGRMLLVLLLMFAFSLVTAFVFGLAIGAAGSSAGTVFELVSQLVQSVVGAGLAVVAIVAAAILYHDLGGESD